MSMFSFEVTKKLHDARRSVLTTLHGAIAGPFFQFVATQAAIRGMVFPEDLEKMGAQIVLANTYHLHLRPGEDLVEKAGYLHGFMKWDGPITTDSGGYQVFSLAAHSKVTENDVTFKSPLDGSSHTLTPESAIEIEAKLGADIIMPLDVCTPYSATREEIEAAVEQTTRWAVRCRDEFDRIHGAGETKNPTGRQALYGIVQGGVYPDLRERSAKELQEIGFFGYSIGGELREGKETQLAHVVRETTKHLPEDSPRYLMGYGNPSDIVEAVRAGVDQFDCVLPIRNARHGQVFYDLDKDELRKLLEDPSRELVKENLFKTVDITKAPFADDHSVFSPDHPVIQKPYTKAYVHHLMRAEVPSATRLTVLHNIYFYVQLMQAIRDIIG